MLHVVAPQKVNFSVGCNVGDAVGVADGVTEGNPVGLTDGTKVGWKLGSNVGLEDGFGVTITLSLQPPHSTGNWTCAICSQAWNPE